MAITSIAVRQPIPTLILSNTKQAGLTGFLRTLTAGGIAADGVTVNSLLPGLHETERIAALYGDSDATAGIPAGRIGDPDEFGAFAAFVCSEQAKYMTGAAIQVDGGASASVLVIRHVSVFTFAPSTSDEQIRAMEVAVATLPGRLRDSRVPLRARISG